MKIKKLHYKNNVTGWNVDEVDFTSLTLLVGASGVGKTQILRALRTLVQIARGKSVNGAEWKMEFEENGDSYVWSGKFENQETSAEDFYHFNKTECNVLSECLAKGTDVIIDRNSSTITYNGNPTIKLDACKSAVELLKEESAIAPVFHAFQKIYFLNSIDDAQKITVTPSINEVRNGKMSLAAIKKMKQLSPIEKLFLLKINDLPEFEDIRYSFVEIFPLVENIDFTIGKFFNDLITPILKIRERGVKSWIYQPDVSSGMFRTLSQIVVLTLADEGDVILIDEFENGLGVNCINQLAELIMYPAEDIQVIMTSHHPYIINTIPFKQWKIVTRSASNVTVHSTEELNIGNHSRHEAFMQLLQSTAYKTGQI